MDKVLKAIEGKSEPLPPAVTDLAQRFFLVMRQWQPLLEEDKVKYFRKTNKECPLCGYHGVCMYFTIQNRHNQNTHQAASHCFTQFELIGCSDSKLEIEKFVEEQRKERKAKKPTAFMYI